MKIRHCRVKIVVFMLSIILVMGMAACSFDANDGTNSGAAVGSAANTEVSQEPSASKPETSSASATETPQSEDGKTVVTGTTETQKTSAAENNGNEYSDTEGISVGDPIVGIVDKYADNIIVIIDTDDPDLVYYFSTKNAQVEEGDSPIAVGDRVAISYRGVMGDEEHPGKAVKVVAESVMYQ